MTIYIFNFIIIALIAGFQNFINNKSLKSIMFILCGVQLLVMLLSRDISVGRDLDSYLYHFNYVFSTYSINDIFNHRFEPLYSLLNVILSNIVNGDRLLIITVAMLSFLPVMYIVGKYSTDPILSLIIYMSLNFYAFTFSGLRQSIAIGITILSIKFIIEKKPFSFFSMVICASLFHKTAIIFIMAYFISKIKWSWFNIILISGMSLFTYIIRVPLFTFLGNLLYDQYDVKSLGFFNWLILSVLSVSLPLIMHKKMIKTDQTNRVFINLVVIGVIIIFVASVTTQLMRIANYYYIFIIILIPEAINTINNVYLRLIVLMLTKFLLFIIFLWFLSTDTFGIIPFTFL